VTTSSTSPRSCAEAIEPLRLAQSDVYALWTGRVDGDQRSLGANGDLPPGVPGNLKLRRPRQVHGSKVLVLSSQDGAGAEDRAPAADPLSFFDSQALPEADALVTGAKGFCLSVLVADCAAVALASAEGVYAAVHVGWRGLLDGVVEQALGAMRALGATVLWAGMGPCIHPCCYAFNGKELGGLAEKYGNQVQALTTRGERALDLPGAVRSALSSGGAQLVTHVDRCTSCGDDSFSYRARKDEQRQALLVWCDGEAS
jgi:copper oxidase (laccase) domain-containing protein